MPKTTQASEFDFKRITSQYPCKCAKCGETIPARSKILHRRGEARHCGECPAIATPRVPEIPLAINARALYDLHPGEYRLTADGQARIVRLTIEPDAVDALQITNRWFGSHADADLEHESAIA